VSLFSTPLGARDLIAGIVGAALAVVCVATYGDLAGTKRAKTRDARDLAAEGAAGVQREARVRASAGSEEDAWRTANANLTGNVQVLQRRLEQNEAEKSALQKELREAKAKLSASTSDAAPAKNEFDLSQDDWKELAKTGTVKARYPCRTDPNMHLTATQAAALGISPSDAAAVERAIVNEQDRLAGVIQPACAKVLGNRELAVRLGTQVCSEVVAESVTDTERDIQLVADIRAGNVPQPRLESLAPLASMLYAQTGSMAAIQAELAQTFGPEEAKRLAFAEELGSCSGSVGGAAPPR
jgi:hypothetical protein